MARLDPAKKGRYLLAIPDDLILAVKLWAMENGVKSRNDAINAILRIGCAMTTIDDDDDQEGE